MAEVKHNCGLVVTHTLPDVYYFLKSNQNRGRDAAGIAFISNGRIDVIKWKGLVTDIPLSTLTQLFDQNKYHTYLGHIRYATKGDKSKLLLDAHPHTIGGQRTENSDHTFILNCDAAIVHNGHINLEFLLKEEITCQLSSKCDSEKLLHYYMQKGEKEIIKNIPGTFTAAIADKRKNEVIVLRDSLGMKPGILGMKDSKYVVSSEDVALINNKAVFEENLDSGSIYYLADDGSFKKEQIVKPQKKQHCFFEWNYIANKNSTIEGLQVNRARRSLGKALAEHFYKPDIDIVTYVPNCPETAAKEYARVTGIPFQPLFYKKNTNRSFLEPTKKERRKSIRNNLHLNPALMYLIQDKTILIIDDSIVRGTNSPEAINMLKKSGAKKIYFASYTPKIGGTNQDPRGCMFGVDMPPSGEFLARGRTDAQINQKLGAKVIYLPIEDMLNTFEKLSIPKENLCTYCIGGSHPFE